MKIVKANPNVYSKLFKSQMCSYNFLVFKKENKTSLKLGQMWIRIKRNQDVILLLVSVSSFGGKFENASFQGALLVNIFYESLNWIWACSNRFKAFVAEIVRSNNGDLVWSSLQPDHNQIKYRNSIIKESSRCPMCSSSVPNIIPRMHLEEEGIKLDKNFTHLKTRILDCN